MDGTDDGKNGEVWEVIKISEIERPQSDGVLVSARQPDPQQAVVSRPSGGVIAEGTREAVRIMVTWAILGVVLTLLAFAIAWFFGASPVEVWDCMWQDNTPACVRDVIDDSGNQAGT